jgi:hypothetical protein
MRGLTRGMLAALPLVLVLTGCGSADGGGQVASAGGDRKDAGSPTTSLNREEMGVKFAQCMRENGVDMPDPVPGKGIELRLDQGTGRAALQKAKEACQQYNPQANGSAAADPQAAEKARKFAECMRANKVEDFADPQPGRPGVKIDGKIQQDPDFPGASEKCQPVLAGGQAVEGK